MSARALQGAGYGSINDAHMTSMNRDKISLQSAFALTWPLLGSIGKLVDQ